MVGGLAALLLNADSGLALALVDPLEALHGIVDVDIGAGRLPELVQGQASAFLDRIENEFGFLKEARHVATDGFDAATDLGSDAAQNGLDAVTDLGGNAVDAAQNGLDAVNALGSNAGDAGKDAIDPVKDVGDEAKDKIEDLF